MITKVDAQCMTCKSWFELEVDAERYDRWRNGEGHIQTMLPELGPDERELLISRTCGACFDDMFDEDDEEDFDDENDE